MIPIINSLPNDNDSHFFKSKSFADEILNVVELLRFVSERVENIVRKVCFLKLGIVLEKIPKSRRFFRYKPVHHIEQQDIDMCKRK